MAHIPVHPKATFVTACDPNPHPTAHPHVPVVPQLGCAEGLNTTALPAAWTGAGSLGEVQKGQGMQRWKGTVRKGQESNGALLLTIPAALVLCKSSSSKSLEQLSVVD